MTNETRERTLVDDVIDAMQRGVDPDVIRELGDQYLTIEGSILYGDYVESQEDVKNVLDYLEIQVPYHEYKDANEVYYKLAQQGLKEISYRLTGVRNE